MANEIAAATGRRKTAVARVRLLPGTGKWLINDRELTALFPSEATRNFMVQPLVLSNATEKYDIVATAKGGGTTGQAGAIRHALSRALLLADPTLHDVLKQAGCFTRDPRMKERKKPGQPGARKRFQFSKR
jgi:small subunit ribosomal protein S9